MLTRCQLLVTLYTYVRQTQSGQSNVEILKERQVNLVVETSEATSGTAEQSAGKREQTKLANRQAILDAGRLVFAELGYEGTTVRDIIRRTDLASGTFYNYFKSKEEVFHALHDDGLQRFKPLLRNARERAGLDFEAYMISAFTAYFQFLINDHLVNEDVAMTPDWTRVRFDTPESMALFDELKGDIINFANRFHFTAVDPEMLTASCVGIAQEIGDRILRGKVTDIEAAARFASSFVLGGAAKVQTEANQ